MHEVYNLPSVTGFVSMFLTFTARLTFPEAIEIVPKSNDDSLSASAAPELPATSAPDCELVDFGWPNQISPKTTIAIPPTTSFVLCFRRNNFCVIFIIYDKCG